MTIQDGTPERRCPRCGETKAADAFSAKGIYCRPCNAAYQREWRAKHPDHARELQREARRRWRVKHRERERTRARDDSRRRRARARAAATGGR